MSSKSSAKEQGESTVPVYERDEALNMYLGLHYPFSGNKEGVDPILNHAHAPAHGLRFPQRVAELLVRLKPDKANRALDVGCAVGGASFELAKPFDHVDAFDFSENFVSAAKQMQNLEDVHFRVPIEADIHHEVRAVHENGVTRDVLEKVTFFTGDACKMDTMATEGKLTTYDGVIMSNLLCRLPDPMACLSGLPRIVNKGGVVLLVTPFSWLKEFTSRDKWLGGFYDSTTSEQIRSKDRLYEVMRGLGFDKIHEEEMPLIIREHQRKYQYIVSQATGWRKVE